MTVDEIYLTIGQNITGAIEHNNWTKARLYLELVGTGVVGYTGDYAIESITHDISVRRLSRDMRNWVRELHAITTEDGNNKWNRAIFTLTPDGKFDMEFIWDEALKVVFSSLCK